MKYKCFSVRLQSMELISNKAYRAVAFNGSAAIIPASQVLGPDDEVHSSDAWWITEWILKKKNLQYSDKKCCWFDESGRALPTIKIEKHVPKRIIPNDTEPDTSLIR